MYYGHRRFGCSLFYLDHGNVHWHIISTSPSDFRSLNCNFLQLPDPRKIMFSFHRSKLPLAGAFAAVAVLSASVWYYSSRISRTKSKSTRRKSSATSTVVEPEDVAQESLPLIRTMSVEDTTIPNPTPSSTPTDNVVSNSSSAANVAYDSDVWDSEAEDSDSETWPVSGTGAIRAPEPTTTTGSDVALQFTPASMAYPEDPILNVVFWTNEERPEAELESQSLQMVTQGRPETEVESNSLQTAGSSSSPLGVIQPYSFRPLRGITDGGYAREIPPTFREASKILDSTNTHLPPPAFLDMFDETGLSWFNIQVPCRLLDEWPPEYHSLRPSPPLYELPSLSIHRRPTDTPEGYCIRIEVGLPQENAITIDDLPSHHGWSSDPNIASWPVIAELEPDRPDSDRYTTKDLRNMRFLAAGFNLCPGHEYLDQSTKLTVKLPITIEIPPFLGKAAFWLPSVQDLVWRSHRNQLLLMFNPDRPHFGLTSLDLHCESISPEEFHRLLQVLAPTISYLKLFQLVPHVPKVWFHPSPTSTILEMQQLQTFLLETYICPGSIMSNFSFPMLQEYKLNPSGRLQPESVPGGYGEMNWETLTHNVRGYPNCLEEPTLSET